jgi:hypothetical protein
VDEPYCGGFKVGGQEIGLDPNGNRRGMTGPVGCWYVEAGGRRLSALVEAGAQPHQPAWTVSRRFCD